MKNSTQGARWFGRTIKHCPSYRLRLPVLAILLGIVGSAFCQQIRWLGGDFGRSDWTPTYANIDVSADGTTVVASGYNNGYQGYVWRLGQDRMRSIDKRNYRENPTLTVSADGMKVYITYHNGVGASVQVFRWEPIGPTGETFTNLTGISGQIGNTWGEVADCTPDGRYLVGYGFGGNYNDRPFIADSSGVGSVRLLPLPQGIQHGYAQAITRKSDGSLVIAGHGGSSSTPTTPLLWTMVNYGATPSVQLIDPNRTLPGAVRVFDVSSDGSRVCGGAGVRGSSPYFGKAFIWIAPSTLRYLPPVTAYDDGTAAFAMTADGKTIVGISANPAGFFEAVRWTEIGNTGNFQVESLNATYASLLWPGSVLYTASAISPDGRYIAGWGYNAWTRQVEVYLLDTKPACSLPDVNGDGTVDDSDLLQILFFFGSSCP